MWVGAQMNARMRGRLATRAETAGCQARSFDAPNVEECTIAQRNANKPTGKWGGTRRPVKHKCERRWTLQQEGEQRRRKDKQRGNRSSIATSGYWRVVCSSERPTACFVLLAFDYPIPFAA